MTQAPTRHWSDGATSPLAYAQMLHESERLAEAEVAYRAVLADEPRSFLALHGLGLIALRQNKLEEGAQLISAALESSPRQADAHLNLSRVQLMLGKPDEALRCAERALALRPADAAAHLARAAALMSGRPAAQALDILRAAVLKVPEHADGWVDLGSAHLSMRQEEDALECFKRALQIDANHRQATSQFALTLMGLHRYEDAALVFERLRKIWPDCAFALGHLVYSKMMICDWLRLDELRDQVAAAIEAGQAAAEPFGLQGYCTRPDTARRAAEIYMSAFFPDRSAELPPAQLGAANAKIRVGYVSGEFRLQATSILLTELLELHDRERFEIYAFDNGLPDGSELRRRIEAAVEVVPIAELDDASAAQEIRSRHIDILVNLNGFFGNARTALFSLRPAPIQVNYLGFPGTMGAGFMDYLMADGWVIPPEHHVHYSEAVVTLPESYQPNDRQRRISAEPITRRDVGLPDEGFVFCCFNNTYKLTPEVFAVWMNLLKRVPGSVLWFYGWVPEAVLNLAEAARSHGVNPARLVGAAYWPLERHLARIALADLFLDTWPYNAHTTGSDALWAGVPMVTCTGDTFASRVGASLLSALNLPELITSNFGDYEALAHRLANDPVMLAGLRERLGAQRSSAPLFDTPRLRGFIESAYTTMVARARAGQAPAAFAVGSDHAA